MVEAEEVLEGVGVTLLGLKLFDELKLTVQKVLVTTTEADEGTGHVLATQLRLASSEVHSCTLHGVERSGENRKLIVGFNAELIELRKLVRCSSSLNNCWDADIGSGLSLS